MLLGVFFHFARVCFIFGFLCFSGPHGGSWSEALPGRGHLNMIFPAARGSAHAAVPRRGISSSRTRPARRLPGLPVAVTVTGRGHAQVLAGADSESAADGRRVRVRTPSDRNSDQSCGRHRDFCSQAPRRSSSCSVTESLRPGRRGGGGRGRGRAAASGLPSSHCRRPPQSLTRAP